tara:strand:- start:6806 stop:6973 length:168 start_codon:yes stop_codon:yes gene_type:complete
LGIELEVGWHIVKKIADNKKVEELLQADSSSAKLNSNQSLATQFRFFIINNGPSS